MTTLPRPPVPAPASPSRPARRPAPAPLAGRWGAMLGFAISAAACGGDDEGPGSAPAAPVGSVEVRWSFARQDGGPASCEAVGAAEIRAFVGGRRSDRARAQAPDGGTPPPVTCGDDSSELWTQLVEGSLPVIIQVFGPTGAVIAEHVTTVRVVPQMRATVDHTFAIGGTGASEGALRLTWNLDGRPAAETCGPAGAATVAFATQPGSIEELSASAPCTDGVVEIDDVRVGSYILRARLLDERGEVLSVDQQSPSVRTDAVTSAGFRFNLESLGRADLRAEWTIDGQPPAVACETEGLSSVEVRFQRLNLTDLEWVDAETATAACAAGSLRFTDLVDVGRPRLELLLLEDVLGDPVLVTSTVTEPFRLNIGQTATVAVDFDLAP